MRDALPQSREIAKEKWLRFFLIEKSVKKYCCIFVGNFFLLNGRLKITLWRTQIAIVSRDNTEREQKYREINKKRFKQF